MNGWHAVVVVLDSGPEGQEGANGPDIRGGARPPGSYIVAAEGWG